MVDVKDHDLEGRLNALLEKCPSLLKQANGKVAPPDLIRLDDLFLKLEVWKHDIKASPETLSLAEKQSPHLFTFSDLGLRDLSQQIDRFQGMIDKEENETICKTPQVLVEALGILEESVKVLTSQVDPFTRLLGHHPVLLPPSPEEIVSLNGLLDQIAPNFVRSAFDYKDFLPQDSFDRIFSDRNIEEALQQPNGISSALLDFIKYKAKKTFATVLLANGQLEECAAIMTSFLDCNFNDEHLSLQDDPQCQFAGKRECSHDPAFNVLHDKKLWKRHIWVQRFFDERWKFLAPIFTETEFRHDLAPNAILPFESVEDNNEAHVGLFSKVQQARIHFSHQTVLKTNGSGLAVAIKELWYPTESSYPHPKDAWESELRILNDIRRHTTACHCHLIPAIGAFQRHNRYYFLFQWADGGNLRQFWERNARPSLSPDFIASVLEQLLGLADFLNCLHGGPPIRVSPTEGSSHSGHWRHGDIKPDNILRFNCSDDQMDPGTFKLADFALTVHHTLATKNRVDPTTMRYGTRKYEGPEVILDAVKGQPRSRRYDIWSMGCVILEFVIWMLYGKDGVAEFDKEPLNADGGDTHFYKVEAGGHMEVGKVAKRWMRIMRADPELSNEGKNTALSDLLDLVEMKLLIVNTDEGVEEGGMGATKAVCRATAQDLKEQLESMIAKGKQNRRYFFTGTDRSNIRAPQAMSATEPEIHSIGGISQANIDSSKAASAKPAIMHRPMTYFILPTAIYRPNDLIQLGQVIVDPRKPFERLAEPLPLEGVLRTRNMPEVEWSATSVSTGETSVGIFARVIKLISAQASAGRSYSENQTLEAARLETQFLEIDEDPTYIERTARVAAVGEWLKQHRHLGKTVYMITGLKIAKPPGRITSNVFGSSNVSSTPQVTLDPKGVIEGGDDASHQKVDATTQASRIEEAFVYAYSLHKLRVAWRQKFKLDDYMPGAKLDGRQDVSVEEEGGHNSAAFEMESVSYDKGDFRASLPRNDSMFSAVDEEDNSPCFVIPVAAMNHQEEHVHAKEGM